MSKSIPVNFGSERSDGHKKTQKRQPDGTKPNQTKLQHNMTIRPRKIQYDTRYIRGGSQDISGISEDKTRINRGAHQNVSILYIEQATNTIQYE